MCAGFVAANPYALLDRHTFWDGIQKQTETAGEDGGKLGLANSTGWTYYLGTFTWGFGWLPSLLALGGIGGLIARHRRLAIVLAPAPILLFLYLGEQSRFFARWMLPIYPILAILAAWALVALVSRFRLRVLLPVAAALALAQGLVFSVHNDVVLARDDTRQVARDWMVENIPAGTKIVVEPIAPDQWAADVGRPLFEYTGSGNRWNKFRTSRSCFFNGEHAPVPVPRRSSSRTTSARLVPERVAAYEEARVLLGRHRLEPVRPRVRRPGGGPGRDPLLRRAAQARRGRVPRQPVRPRLAARAVLVRLLVQLLPADVRAAGAGDRHLPVAWRRLRDVVRLPANGAIKG